MRSVLLIAVILVTLSPTVSAQIRHENVAAEKKLIHLRQYFEDMGAFAILRNRGERAADAYTRPQYEVDPKREKCFPNYGGGPIRSQGIQNRSLKTEMDLSGLLSAGISDVIKGELSGKILLQYETETNIKVIRTEDADRQIFTGAFSPSTCPELVPVLKQQRGDGKYVVIRSVYHVEGELKQSFTLKLTGALMANAQTAFRDLLQKLRLPIPNLKLDAAGEYKNIDSTSYRWTLDMPAAFRPWHLSKQHMDEMYDNYLKDGVGGFLSEALGSERRVKEFFSKYGQLEKEAFDVLGRFATGPMIPFEPEDKRQVEYVRFMVNLNIARRIVVTSAATQL